MSNENGFNPNDEMQLVEIDKVIFGVKIVNAWVDGRCIEAKDFTPEITAHLACHHAETIKSRFENLGG